MRGLSAIRTVLIWDHIICFIEELNINFEELKCSLFSSTVFGCNSYLMMRKGCRIYLGSS